jgi:hypothetical protein
MKRASIALVCMIAGACTADVFVGPDPLEDETSSSSTDGPTPETSTSGGTELDTTSDSTGKPDTTSDPTTDKPETTSDSSDKGTTTKPTDSETSDETKGTATDKDPLDCADDDWDCFEAGGTTSPVWAG